MNEVSADEWSETKVVGKTNVGENQKLSVKINEADPKGSASFDLCSSC